MAAADGELAALLKKTGSVVLDGFPGQSGSVTSPGTFANILFLTVPPGTYTVNWTVSLSGTLGAGDANNFGLYANGVFVASSVNAGAAGSYPQTPQQVTITSAAPGNLKILSGGTAPTAGAVYGASVPNTGNGNGTLHFDPDNANQRWEVTGIVVSTNQGLAVPYPVATIYVGPETSPGNSRGASASGNQDVFSNGCIDVGNADSLAIVWTGGVPGSTAFAQVTGSKYTRRQ